MLIMLKPLKAIESFGGSECNRVNNKAYYCYSNVMQRLVQRSTRLPWNIISCQSPVVSKQCLKYLLSYNRELKFMQATSGPQVINFFTMLNTTEPEILNARKYENKQIQLFPGLDKPIMLFFLLINVKMAFIIGILTFMSRKNFMPS